MTDFASASSARHEALQKRWEARREAAVVDDESTDEFWASWGVEREAMKSTLASGISTTEALEAEEGRLKALSAKVAKASSWLPPFDSKRAIREAKELDEALAEVRKKVAPRRKFGFKARQAASRTTSATEGSTAAIKAAAKTTSPTEVETQKTLAVKEAVSTHRGFFGQRGEVLVWDEPEDPSSELHLADLEDCVVFAPGTLGALRLKNVRNCDVFAGAVTGSAFIVNVKNSKLRLGARQLRIHDTYDTDFYVAVNSGPIIEDCDGCRFASYAAKWHQLDTDEDKATPRQVPTMPTGQAWRDVQDFKWLKAQHSPHWSLLPDAEYQTTHRNQTARDKAAYLGLDLLQAETADETTGE